MKSFAFLTSSSSLSRVFPNRESYSLAILLWNGQSRISLHLDVEYDDHLVHRSLVKIMIMTRPLQPLDSRLAKPRSNDGRFKDWWRLTQSTAGSQRKSPSCWASWLLRLIEVSKLSTMACLLIFGGALNAFCLYCLGSSCSKPLVLSLLTSLLS